MAAKEWTKISASVSKDEMNAIEMICERKKTNKNRFFRSILMEHLQPILEPNSVKTISGIGENTISYNSEKGTFQWSVDLGLQGTQVVAENLSESFLNNLAKALGKGLEQKQREDRKVPKGKVRVPREILDYKVK